MGDEMLVLAGMRPSAKFSHVIRYVSFAVSTVQNREVSGIADIGAPTATISLVKFFSCGRTLPHVYAQSEEQRFVPSGKRKG